MQTVKESKAERTQRHIIEKVAPVFNRKGYAATSLSDLTRATGLTKGSIYGNFRNKDDVALAAFEHNVDFINNSLRANIEQANTYRQKLLAYPQTFKEIYSTVLSAGGCPILNTAVDSSEINSSLQEAVRNKINWWKKAITKIIEQGAKNREFSSYIDPSQTAMVMICLVEGGYAMSRATGDTAFLESALTEMEIIIEAL